MGIAVRRYIDFLIITYPYSTCITVALFCSSIPTSLFILKMFFFVFVYVIFVQYGKHCSKNIEIAQKLRSRGHDNIIISISMSTMNLENSTCQVRSDILRKL